MHHSRLCAVLIDCKTADVDEAARFWAAALGRPVDIDHPMSRDNYRMLATPIDEPIVEIQRVEHESRVHIDIETDDIPAEVRRLERLGATVVDRPERWVVMQAPTGQRFCVVRVQRPVCLSETYALKYWWCSPPRTGIASGKPTVWTARGTGASLCSDMCVRASL
jgi:predicted enzyme related to lactoylglutathione lyase